MKNTTKKLLLATVSGIGILCVGCQDKAKEPASAEADATEMSNNLDLEVVISLFGESKDLEDFERKLNEPERQISNMDLSGDGEVDYLRVVESSMDQTHLISVQAVTGENQYQDVATFDIEKDKEGQTQVQVVGDPYVYGPNYAIRPTFSTSPLIIGWLWGASYSAWNSPYSWGRYPSYYQPWRPYPYNDYRKRVRRYHNTHYVYHYGPPKRSKYSKSLYKKSKRNDYGSKHPKKSFSKRHKGVENRYKLDQKRAKAKPSGHKRPVHTQKPSGKPSKPGANHPKPNKPNKPSAQPSKPNKPNKPSAQPSKPNKPNNKPSAQPSKPNKPNNKPSGKPSGKRPNSSGPKGKNKK